MVSYKHPDLMTDDEIAGFLESIQQRNQNNLQITFEEGWRLIDVIAAKGARIARLIRTASKQ